MPRADSKQHLGTQFYHSQFSNPPYLPESPSPTLSPTSQSTPQSSTPTTAPPPKKKHVCSTCERAFTTSGHLARHSRVHTGERNHKCPFPGCETRCSRQDNLQQHYRIHLSPGSRRSSARSAAAKAMNGKKGNTNPTISTESAAPPLSSPPPLETARLYSHQSTPPDSPPPLAQATLPATASLPLTGSRMQQQSSPGRSSTSSSPDTTSYPPPDHLVSLQTQGLANPPNYNYPTGTATYQEQSQRQGYTYVHTTSMAHGASGSSNGNSFSSYSNSHDSFSVSPIQPNQNGHRENDSPVSISSRHSISHISHPQTSYQSSSDGPHSPRSSVSPHNSGPPTPNYPVFHDDSHSYHQHHHQHPQHHGNGMMNNDHHHHQQHQQHQHQHQHQQPQQQPQHNHPQSHLLVQQNGTHYGHNTARFNSPPPTLAPIQGERLIRRDDSRHSQNHSTSPYIPQPVSDYPYHQGMALGHGAWKAESGMRKGLGAALV